MKIKNNFLNSQSLYIFLTTLFVLSYFYGFLVKEDSSGGGKIDFTLHIFHNFILFYKSNLFKLDWNLYDSTSLPLHYILSKIIFSNDNPDQYQLFWFLFSFIGLLFFYLMLSQKFGLKNKITINILFLASTILLSPYFRTSAFWGLEENTGIVMMLITLYFYLYFQNTKKNIFFVLTIFFASVTFYSRQSYLFLPILIFILFFDKSNFFKRENFFFNFFIYTFFITFDIFFLSMVWFGTSNGTAKIK